ncbi:UNVERIFIED_ORG: diguanylate cyclase (GGDEF)-like protein [Variovorax paradoxus]|nr:diguanylate cyclase (GGDEF)-like protein [Variovorax paradoxus]
MAADVSHGLLAGLMVCGLVLLVVSGARLHGWYLLASGFALAAFAGLERFAPDDPLAHWAALALVLWAACRLQFARQLLGLSRFVPRLDKVALVLLAALALAALHAAVETRLPSILRVLQALVVASTVILAAGALAVRRRTNWPALLFCAGAVLLMAGISIAHLPGWSEQPWASGRVNPAQAAVIAELAVLALAAAARLRAERAMEMRAHALMAAPGIDALTGAASRTGFERRGEEWLREDRQFSLMLIDLNGFAAVSERHGRAASNAVLAAIAQRLREQVRADDLVARLEGNAHAGDRAHDNSDDSSFAILLVGNPPRQKLAEMAIRIETAGARPVAHEGRLLAGGELSMGIACHPADGDTLAGLLESADRALQHCKRQRMGPAYVFAGELGQRQHAGGAAA